MEEYNKSYGANNHTSLLSHAQSLSPNGWKMSAIVLMISFDKNKQKTIQCP